MVVSLLTVGVASNVGASTKQVVQEQMTKGDKPPVVVPLAAPRAGAFDCGATLFFGGVTLVGSFLVPGPWSWLGLANTAYTADSIRRNQICAADSFWNHIGYRELCWQAHFIGWSPTGSGHAMFDNKDGRCNISPATADFVLCDYIKPAYLAVECVNSYLQDIIVALVNMTNHLWN